MRYDVTAYGLVGDNATLNDAAMAALLATAPDGSVFYWPSGLYLFAHTIDLSARKLWTFEGDGFHAGSTGLGSTIQGSFAGPVVKYLPQGSGNTFFLRGLTVRNGNGSGSCFAANPSSGVAIQDSSIRDCQFTGPIGVDLGVENFCVTLSNVNFNGQGFAVFPNGIGLLTGSTSVFVEGCNFSGWKEAIRACGSQLSVIGSRFEENGTGLLLGVNASGGSYNLSGSFFAGNEFEANGTGIEVVALRGSSFMGNGITGSNGSFAGGNVPSVYGIHDHGSSYVTYHATIANNNFSGAAIYQHDTGVVGWYNCFAGSSGTGPAWKKGSGLQGTTWTGCNDA